MRFTEWLSENVEKLKKEMDRLRFFFFLFRDNVLTTKDLLSLIKDKDLYMRVCKADALGSAFAHVTDKEQATKDLLALTKDEASYVRGCAANALGSAFAHVTDKEQAWKNLVALTQDEDGYVPEKFYIVPGGMGMAGSMINSVQKLKDLLALTKYEDTHVRGRSISAIASVFPHVTDKEKAWIDIVALTKDEHWYVRRSATFALRSVFTYVIDKEQAWKDMLTLTKDEDSFVQGIAISALGAFFAHITDKEQAWKDMLELTKDDDWYVRGRSADAIGSAFVHVTDKEQSWIDMFALTKDMYSEVRSFANYSLGRLSIFKATEAKNEEDFKEELEQAIYFFTKSAKEAEFYNPASFCIPFYRSFYTILFKKIEMDEEIQIVQKYLGEAKSTVEKSESKEKLLEAVENLSNALKEVLKSREMGFKYMRSTLNICRQYCELTAELLDDTEDIAPVATKLIRKGLPIFNEKIKGIIAEIREKAMIGCQQSVGTPFEDLAFDINNEVQSWHISNQEQLTRNVENLIFILKFKILSNPDNKFIHDEIENIKNEKDIVKQYEKISYLIGSISTKIIMIDKSKKIEIKNASVGNINQSDDIYLDKSKGQYNSTKTKSNKKKLIFFDSINSPATIAAFVGFMSAEIGTYFYSIDYNHLISVTIALFVFFIVAIFGKERK